MCSSSSNSLADCTTLLFIVGLWMTKHMTGNLSCCVIIVEKISVYYTLLEMINLSPILVMEIESRNVHDQKESTCFVRDLQGNDLLTGNHGFDLYTISLQETTSSTLIFFMAKASPTQAWLWHRRLSHLNFDYITLLSKKDIVTGLPKLK
ncbi:retrovirus-related pol polyprotein from transposon TNT 1-94 [Tanacetum coccineum]